MSNKEIEIVKEEKGLGLMIQDNLSPERHINMIAHKHKWHFIKWIRK